MPDADPGPADAVRDHLLSTHAETLAALVDAADAVAERGVAESADAEWFRLDDGRPATADRDALVPVLRAALEESGLLSVLPDLLTSAVDAAGYRLSASPVPAPPYVTVTSTGPVLRATVADGRLVVNIDCFEVVRGLGGERDGTVAYARTATDPVAALSVTFARSD